MNNLSTTEQTDLFIIASTVADIVDAVVLTAFTDPVDASDAAGLTAFTPNPVEVVDASEATVLTAAVPPIDFMGELCNIVEINEYVKSCVSNKETGQQSLSYLITRSLSQSDKIKLGTGVERVLTDIILKKNSFLENSKPKNKKGEKEIDHLFIDTVAKIIHCAEIKSNLELDTEKCKSTSEKCLHNLAKLQLQYPEYTVQMYLVGTRYFEKTRIPKVIMNKYTSITENVVGINEYFANLGVGIRFETEEQYKQFLNCVADNMFE